MLKKVLVVLGVLCLVLIVAAIGALIWLDGKYGIRKAAALSSIDHGGRESDVLLVVYPEHALPLIEQTINSSGALPGFINVVSVLPYEITGMLTFHPDARRYDMRLFINERRLGPLITGRITEFARQRGLRRIQLAETGMTMAKRGELTLDATMETGKDTERFLQTYWSEPRLNEPNSLDGNHLAELIVNNRNGALFSMVAELSRQADSSLSPNLNLMAEPISYIDRVMAEADMISVDQIAVNLTIECQRDGDETNAESIRTYIEFGLPSFKSDLKQQYGITLEGTTVRDGLNIEGAYTLSGLSALLQLPAQG